MEKLFAAIPRKFALPVATTLWPTKAESEWPTISPKRRQNFSSRLWVAKRPDASGYANFCEMALEFS